ELFDSWKEPWGDRMTELVLIGIEIDWNEVEEELEACLLTEQEMAADWRMFRDPLPAWPE
ncbi:MAG TPA: GTP-binding protein, partial [Paenibacillus sp.]|nr:GTP-binding protein [Paenibacillus sp.]